MKTQMSNVKCQNYMSKLRSFKILVAVLSFAICVLSFTSPAFASTLSFSPATGTFNRNCPFALDILLDTKGVATDGTDAWFNFDASKFSAVSIDTQGKLYPEYPGNEINNDAGKIKVSGLASQTAPYSGSGKLATINFTVKETASTGVTQTTFDFDPNNKGLTNDSNVVEHGTTHETLDSVTNGSYTIGTGSCSSTPVPPAQGAGALGAPTGGATPSATFIPLKTLPPAGSEKITYMFAIIGLSLTILGILGLVLL